MKRDVLFQAPMSEIGSVQG